MTIGRPYRRANVVAVVYNNASTIEDLLESLQDEETVIAQVVLVDNASTDDSLRVIDSWRKRNPLFPLTVRKSDNVGFSRGIFVGTQLFVDAALPTLCINPDARLSAGTLRVLLDVLNSDPRNAIVTAPLVSEHGVPDSASIRKLPRVGSSVAYALLGKVLPAKARYNSRAILRPTAYATETGTGYSFIEATTGALMLVDPSFRSPKEPIFDLSYWMYGEDLQLCSDLAAAGYYLAIAHTEPSLHLKGVSSGWPRSVKSNVEFHRALQLYYLKNFSRGPIDYWFAKVGIFGRLLLSLGVGYAVSAARKAKQPGLRSPA